PVGSASPTGGSTSVEWRMRRRETGDGRAPTAVTGDGPEAVADAGRHAYGRRDESLCKRPTHARSDRSTAAVRRNFLAAGTGASAAARARGDGGIAGGAGRG